MRAMKVHLIGTGTAAPDPNHTQSCTLVSTDDGAARLVIDLGGGAINRIPDWESVRCFLFTHDHPDHVGGLDQLLQSHLFGRLAVALEEVPPRITVLGPHSVRELLDEIRDRHFSGPHSLYRLNESLVWKSLMDGVSLQPLPGVKVDCLASGHTRDSLSFRIVSGGKTLAITSDASVSGRLTEILERSDLAVVECSLPPGMHMPGHLSADEIVRLVVDLGDRGPRRIILTHLYPPALDHREAIRTLFPPPHRETLQFGEDGQEVSV